MALVEAGESIALDPSPGFVVKTRILESKKDSLGTKVFINVCHDAQVPQPPVEFEPSVVFPLIIDNQWEIPLILSSEKDTTDKKGVVSRLYDCCINTTCFQWCQINADLRTILIEWCIEAVEMLYEVTLEREYTIPKMLCKGELSRTVVRQDELTENGFQKRLQELKNNETLGLLQELDGGDTDELEELPDLMNVSGEQRRPLIEELGEMKISEEIQEVQSKGQGISTSNSQGISTTKSQDPSSTTPATPLHYELNYTKLSSTYQLLIKLVCSHISALTLGYSTTNHCLVLTLHDPSVYFSKKSPHALEVPLPNTIHLQSAADVKSYWVGDTLYIFC
ncbi:uncharacterized protein CANTADRAFT_49669 [Suhomyces tanzawaensis NRRL Y-17324]|uniref:PIH1 N-terminal domain-containing protein n=1 Tax=Suhomyces tanzawaensis NRRL Y-17324 TaxID=984487 RepID=A0A1E4SJD2_9ASCO|nr:uncharacterized protein CANTADRAFT_49669 [Suhomyces tanzawaensis NRRL Y-17324]ODV79547.1 hypothetical protein CANTADRAFT_49669 [Suhomyces tanzawaensis NRRL Y-17324]